MDLTFLPLPDDLCRLIGKMKIELESPPAALLDEIRERKPMVYRYFSNFDTNKFDNYFGVEALEWENANSAWAYEKNIPRKNVRQPDYCRDNWLTWGHYYVVNPTIHLFREIYPDCEHEETRLYLNTPKAMKKYLRDNKVKGYSKLRKDELRTMCLSF